MIFVKPIPNRILFIGGDYFRSPPNDLNTTLIIPKTNEENYLNYAISNKVSSILIIPQPNVQTICESVWLKDLINTFPVGMIWYDYNIHHEWVHKLKNCFHIVLDNQRINEMNIMPLWTPVSIELTSPEKDRQINIGFYGNVDCEQRRTALKFLTNKRIPVFTTGNNDWNKVDYHTMYHFMKNTKIILNFSNTRFYPNKHKHQFKGRVLEAMRSGAMVIENENDQSDLYFQPGKDLIWFKNHDEMFEKISYYLSNDIERIKIASNAQYLCKMNYDTDEWWRVLLPRLFNFKCNVF